MLVIALGIGLLSCLLEVRQDQRVYPFGLSNWPVPETCFSRSVTGFPCPGCGLTRSFIDLAHGRWDEAWQHHRIGWLFAIAVLAQIPYRVIALAGWWRPRQPNWGLILCGEVLIAALIMNWCWQIVVDVGVT
ncbi:MAG TPA: DUF2752 domain-containing protein [Schlesneria sp.]|jgi:hypothetical protein